MLKLKRIGNLFIKNKSDLKILQNLSIKKFSMDKQTDEIKFRENYLKKNQLDVIIPSSLQPYYSFGIINTLPLYENSKLFGKFYHYIPFHKLTTIIFIYSTIKAYGTILFQPNLLVTLFLANKFLVCNSPKYTHIFLLTLEENCEKIYLRTVNSAYTIYINDLVFEEKPIQTFDETFYELKTNKGSFYLSEKGTYLNFQLLKMVLSGKYEKVNFQYEEI